MAQQTLFYNLADIYREIWCNVFNILDLTSQDSLLSGHVALGSPEYQNHNIQNN